MAYKVFSNGDALTGGELNTYLMNQSVMTFASATARTAALPSPTEGMVTYLDDQNTLYLWNGSTWQSIVSVVGTGNILINSNFLINQRSYVSGTALASGSYGIDRWKATSANASMTFTYSANGFPVTINSGGSFAQVIEQFNIPGAGSYTLSWSGTATGRVYNSGATAPSYAASPITVTLDGTANVVVEFEATGGTKTLEKVQLEKGSNATNWRLQSNGYEAELAKCKRYFERFYQGTIAVGHYWSATNFYGVVWYKNEKRVSPTVTVSSATGVTVYNSVSGRDSTTLAGNSGNTLSLEMLAVTSSATTGQGGAFVIKSGNYIDASAEL